MDRIRLGVLYGGKSAEHEISLRSARSLIQAINSDKYEILLISVSREGKWYLQDQIKDINPAHNNSEDISESEIIMKKETTGTSLMKVSDDSGILKLDVVFPIMHGTYGEDGTIQGFLKALDIPFVGVDLMTSAIGMDKDVAKRIWRDGGIPIARYYCIHRSKRHEYDADQIINELGLPLFVKPANAGSSVGVHKVQGKGELKEAIDDALQYDHKVLVEEAIIGREIECAVLGNESPKASVLGEIIPQADFYSYEAKYLDENGAILKIPAEINPEIQQAIQQSAIKAFQLIGGEGLSRVDFFLQENGHYIINEINTMPGFTEISMYPKLWEYSGIAYSDLIDRLIQLAIERHKRDQKLKLSFH